MCSSRAVRIKPASWTISVSVLCQRVQRLDLLLLGQVLAMEILHQGQAESLVVRRREFDGSQHLEPA